MKTDFEFSSKKLLCSINYFDCLKEISLFISSAHPQAFCGWQFAKFKFAAMVLLCCHLTKHKLVYLNNSSIRFNWIYFKGFLYCLVNIKSITALTQSFFGHFLVHGCRPQRSLTDLHHVFVTQTLRILVFVVFENYSANAHYTIIHVESLLW